MKSPSATPASAADLPGPAAPSFGAAPLETLALFFLLMARLIREGCLPRLAEGGVYSMGIQRRFVVIFNPMAGRRKPHEVLRRVTTRLDERIASVIETSIDGAFVPRVRESLRSVAGDTGMRPIAVAVGGDGTLSMALNALAHPDDATLAIVPAGSGNDFAAALDCATVDAALDALERETVRTIDYGLVNDRRFANCVGMGLDAEVGALAARL